MGIPLFPDAVALVPGAVLGLLGLLLGLRRWSASWPMRWLVPLFAASAAAAFVVLHLIAYHEVTALFYASGPVVRTIIAAVAFVGTFVGLTMFMGNLRERVAVWTAGRRIGLRERVLGGLGGAVFGLLLLVPPYLLYEATRSEDADPAWARESALLPHIRSADAAARSALSSLLSSSRERSRSER
jgi:hypothetical protein